MTKPLRIAVVVGSLRKGSYNRQFAEALVKQFPAGVEATFVPIDALPLYNQDDDGAPTAAVTQFKRAIAESDGVLFATAEYNRSVPGVLKNALDHGSRPYGESCWSGKPAGIVGVSPGAPGTSMAQQHLRNVISYLAMPQLSQPEMYVQWRDGLIVDGRIGEQSRAFVQKFVDAFVAWVEHNQPAA